MKRELATLSASTSSDCAEPRACWKALHSVDAGQGILAGLQPRRPAEVTNVLAWLRSNLKAPPLGRTMLFDKEPGFAA